MAHSRTTVSASRSSPRRKPVVTVKKRRKLPMATTRKPDPKPETKPAPKAHEAPPMEEPPPHEEELHEDPEPTLPSHETEEEPAKGEPPPVPPFKGIATPFNAPDIHNGSTAGRFQDRWRRLANAANPWYPTAVAADASSNPAVRRAWSVNGG